MLQEKLPKISWLRNIILWVLCAFSVLLLIWFITQVYFLRQVGAFRSRHIPGRKIERSLRPEQIQTWMTFGYVNRVFALPSEYLRQHLNILDSHYPNVQIGHYAKAIKLNTHTFLDSVRNQVKEYEWGKK